MTLAGSLTTLCLSFSTLQAGGQASFLFSPCSLQTCRPEPYSHSCGSPVPERPAERSAVLGEQGPPTAPCGAGGFLEGALSSRARNQGGPGSGDREEGMEGPRTLCSWAPGAERVGQRALRTAAEQAGGESRDTTQRYCKKRIEAERWESYGPALVELSRNTAA